MPRPGAPRLHRLPQRLDYTLIPAPLDLSLSRVSEISEKSPLPAVIITPSSPSDDHRFSIAFLAPPPKPTVRQRLGSFFSFRARTTLLLLVIGFVMVCHLLAHKIMTGRPHMEFTVQDGSDPSRSGADWFGSFLGPRVSSADDNKREFIVMEHSASES